MRKHYKIKLVVCIVLFANTLWAQQVASFEDLMLDETGYWNGSNGSGEFTSGSATFNNSYNSEYNAWSGFAYSNINDTETAGMNNQFACFAGKGVYNSDKYGVAYLYGEDTITFEEPTNIAGTFLTNSTYAAISMRDGDSYAKKFGGETGNDPDWFKLTIKGIKEDGTVSGTLDFYLSDFRFEDNSKDYILDYWKWTDLSSLGKVKQITFGLTSSDVGAYGMNTPAYFCLDNLTTSNSFEIVNFSEKNLDAESFYNGSDEQGGFGSKNTFFANSYTTEYGSWTGWSYSNITDTETPGFGNQYSAITGFGVNETDIYAVAYSNSSITFSNEGIVLGTYITNSTYAALSMRDGDSYAKKFGGETGNDPDWFKLTIIGRNNAGDSVGAVEFYLADYQFDDNTKDYIVDSWRYVDLTPLGTVRSIDFSLSSTDNGEWGMNTPAYFCLDGLSHQSIPEKEILFTVKNGDGVLDGVNIEFNNTTVVTDENGEASFNISSPEAQMVITANKDGYNEYSEVINAYTTDTKEILMIFTNLAEKKQTKTQVYPNPAKSTINIKCNETIEQIDVFTIQGKLKEHIFINNSWNNQILIDNYNTGVYYLKIKTKTKTETIRFIKQ